MSSFLIGLASFISWILVAILIATMTRRTLAVAVSWPRAFGLGLIWLLVTSPMLTWLGRRSGVIDERHLAVDDPMLVGVVGALGLAWLFVAGLALVVLAEVLVPAGSVPGPVRVSRTLPAAWRRLRRYSRITAILTRRGLSGFLGSSRAGRSAGERTRVAVALRRALEDCGATFVKLGQNLATRPDLIGEDFASELSALHTDVSPVPWPQTERVLVQEWGCPLAEIVSRIDHEPIAAASVGQVHTARLADAHHGREVVVKVQRPRAEAQIRTDLDILSILSARLMRSAGWARRIGLDGLVDGFAASLEEELDYRVEAANAEAVSAGVSAAEPISIPSVISEVSTRRVLVMERAGGVPLARASAQLARLAPEQRRALATALVRQVVKEVLVTGIFHADLHPGNVLLDGTDRLVILDLGSVGHLDDVSRGCLVMLLAALSNNDSQGATDCLMELLGRPDGLAADRERGLEREVGTLLTRLSAGPTDMARTVNDLMALVIGHGFSVPPQLAAAFRCLATVEATVTLLDPDADLIDLARRSGTELLTPDMTVEGIRAAMGRSMASNLPVLRRMPRQLGRLVDQAEQGRLTARVRILDHPDDRSWLSSQVHLAMMTILASTATVASVALMIADRWGPRLSERIGVFALLGTGLLLVGVVLALRVLIRIFVASRR